MEKVDELFESLQMRVLTKMLLIGIVSFDKADDLRSFLSEEERKLTIPMLIQSGYVTEAGKKYYLTRRGCALGSFGLRKLADLDILDKIMNEVRNRRL